MRLELKGLDKASKRYREMAQRARDLTPAATAAANDIKTLVADSFRRSTDPSTGKKWAPLADSTVARRRNGSSKPLLDTGVLSRSIAAEPSSDSVIFGTNVPYAGPHQFGSKARKIPQRRFLPSLDGETFGGLPNSPARATLARIAQRVLNYITTGRATATAPKAPDGKR